MEGVIRSKWFAVRSMKEKPVHRLWNCWWRIRIISSPTKLITTADRNMHIWCGMNRSRTCWATLLNRGDSTWECFRTLKHVIQTGFAGRGLTSDGSVAGVYGNESSVYAG